MFDRGGLVGLAVAVLYLWLAPSHIVDGDNAEFSTLSVTGGIAHPSGYPLYVLYLRATSWLPGATAAHTAGMATVVVSVAHVLVLHAACRAWGARPLAASIAVAIFAGGPVVLRMYTQAEAFAGNGLVVSAILWLAAPRGPWRGGPRVALLALIAGLGLANHLSCALVAPVGLWGAITGLRELPHRRARIAVAAVAIGALVVGLLPYLYLFVAPGGGVSWQTIDSPGQLLHHALRRDYGGSLQFGATGVDVPYAVSLGGVAGTVGRGLLYVPALIGLAMLGAGAVRGPARAAWASLALAVVLAGPVLAAGFNVPPIPGVPTYVLERFHLLVIILLVVPFAVGLDRGAVALLARLRRSIPREGTPAPPAKPSGSPPPAISQARSIDLPRRSVQAAIALFVLAVAVAPSLPQLARVHSRAVEAAIENLLASAPQDAVVLFDGDIMNYGGRYVQIVLGRRPDVVVINGRGLGFDWYRARIAARLGFDPVADGADELGARVARAVHAHGRPLLASATYDALVKQYPSYPYGLALRVLPAGSPLPPIEDVLADNLRVFGEFELDYPTPHRGDDWAARMHDHYAHTWRLLEAALVRAGRSEDASKARAILDAIAPR